MCIYTSLNFLNLKLFFSFYPSDFRPSGHIPRPDSYILISSKAPTPSTYKWEYLNIKVLWI